MVEYTPKDRFSQSTDYNLDYVYLITPGAFDVLDLKPYWVELNYYEDIFNNTISGRLHIADSVGVLNLSSLNGTEYIVFKFNKKDEAVPIERTFRVISVTNRAYDKGLYYENYNIDFCSDELLLSEQYRISKSYNSTTISSIIEDILKNYLNLNSNTKKKYYIEKTKGIYDLVLPNKKIFETINWLSTYAQSDSWKIGGDMLFFETSQGYRFNSLQTLYEFEPQIVYYYDPKNVRDVSSDLDQINGQQTIRKDMYNIFIMDVVNSFDTLDATMKGTFSNRVFTFDPLTRQKYTTDFNYNYYHDNTQSLNDNKLVSNYKNRFGKTMYEPPPKELDSGVLRVAICNNRQVDNNYLKNKQQNISKDLFIEQYLPNRVAALNLSNYSKLKITVPGNSDLIAGRTIELKVFGTEIIDKSGRDPDPYLSGNYIISSVRHMIYPTRYQCVLEIMKDSSKNDYSNPNDGDPLWNALVTGVQNLV